MFERYTEKARRTIFFARYEASQFGSDFITLEHLLLGLLREDACLQQFGGHKIQGIRDYIERHCPATGKPVSTSGDLPLDRACQQLLIQVGQAAEAIPHRLVDTSDLVLGLLGNKESVAAKALRKFGIEDQSYRDALAGQFLPKPLAPANPSSVADADLLEPEPLEVATPRLAEACTALAHLVQKTAPELDTYSEAEAFHTLRRGDWIRKVALGHLIDWACAHQQWFARALTEPKIAVFGYPVAEWVTAQKYREAAWGELTDLWLDLNRLLVHVIAQVPETKLATSCRIGLDEPIPLERLIVNYVKFCQDEMAEILTRR